MHKTSFFWCICPLWFLLWVDTVLSYSPSIRGNVHYGAFFFFVMSFHLFNSFNWAWCLSIFEQITKMLGWEFIYFILLIEHGVWASFNKSPRCLASFVFILLLYILFYVLWGHPPFVWFFNVFLFAYTRKKKWSKIWSYLELIGPKDLYS